VQLESAGLRKNPPETSGELPPLETSEDHLSSDRPLSGTSEAYEVLYEVLYEVFEVASGDDRPVVGSDELDSSLP